MRCFTPSYTFYIFQTLISLAIFQYAASSAVCRVFLRCVSFLHCWFMCTCGESRRSVCPQCFLAWFPASTGSASTQMLVMGCYGLAHACTLCGSANFRSPQLHLWTVPPAEQLSDSGWTKFVDGPWLNTAENSSGGNRSELPWVLATNAQSMVVVDWPPGLIFY